MGIEGFTLYSVATGHKLVEIVEGKVTVNAFAQGLKKIKPSECFPFVIRGEKEKEFGDVKSILPEDPLYPKALMMYCMVQFLERNPQAFTDKPKSSAGDSPAGCQKISPLNKV
jgi:hypothetical protein